MAKTRDTDFVLTNPIGRDRMRRNSSERIEIRWEARKGEGEEGGEGERGTLLEDNGDDNSGDDCNENVFNRGDDHNYYCNIRTTVDGTVI